MNFVAPFSTAYAAIAAAIAGLTGWWGEATNKVHLMKNNPNIDPNTVVGSFTQANFDGYAALQASAAAAVYTDPLSGQLLMRVPPPAGGWKFVTTGTTSLPMTIYGAYMTDTGGTTLMGAVKFDTPIVLTAIGQIIDLGTVEYFVNPVPIGG